MYKVQVLGSGVYGIGFRVRGGLSKNGLGFRVRWL